METYFRAEKGESLLFLVTGILAIGFAVFAWLKWGTPMFKGLAIPLVLVGLIEVAVGGTVHSRTDRQVAALTAQLNDDPAAYRAAELTRMAAVMKSFRTIKLIEIVIITAGITMLLLLRHKPFWLGIGAGLVLQGAMALTLDVFAEARGQEYIDQVQSS